MIVHKVNLLNLCLNTTAIRCTYIILKGPAIKHTAHSTRFATLSTEILSMLFKARKSEQCSLKFLMFIYRPAVHGFFGEQEPFPSPFLSIHCQEPLFPLVLFPDDFWQNEKSGMRDYSPYSMP